jgi:uncharacterized protein Veg
MVQNIIKLSEKENRIINMVKAKFGMKNKNQALGFMIQIYAKHFLPEALQPTEKPKRILDRQRMGNVEELRKVIRE